MTIPESRLWRKKLKDIFRPPSSGTQVRIKPVTPRAWLNFHQTADKGKERRKEELVVHEKGPDSSISTSDWVITIKEKLDQVPLSSKQTSSLDHCIFRVPKNLREVEPKAYVPLVVSIGPYHRGKPCLADMEKHKWRLLHHVLERTEHKLEVYLEALLELEAKTRRCYANPMKGISSHEFVEVMLLDSCFILELLRVSVKGFIYCGYGWCDPIFTSRGVLPCIQRDLLMLENQLPLFVLDRVFELMCDCEPSETESVARLALQFFNSVIPGCKNALSPDEPGLHFVHIVRLSLIPSVKPTLGCAKIKQDYKPQVMIPRVETLRDSGVIFQKKHSNTFMDIEFKNGVLHIPPLVIHDSTKAIFLNLVAFEQYYPHCSNHITSYVSFMDGLITCPSDVSYLRHAGIVSHMLGSEENVARLFNNICKEVAFDIHDCYLHGVSADLNRYFLWKWYRWRAALKREYFSSPWAIISVLVGILLIVLTASQTFYNVFGYYVRSS